ncbi:MAG: TRAP transporter substrate-binding protein DctP [Fidelibacterota bacterium]
MIKRALIFLLFIHAQMANPAFSSDRAKYIIKFATIAPEGSTWMKIMNRYNREVMERTHGEVKFRIYPGGVAGDEKDVIRKMRMGQIHAAGFTGVGLGDILPEVRVMDLPFLFNNTEEIDYIYNQLYERFSKAFEQKGYILLGWVEVGFVYIFTESRVNSPDDLKKIKMWVWEGDPLARSTFESLGFSPIPLTITDVFTSLQTGLINGVYASPLGAVALQWFTKVNYMLDHPVTNSAGALLMTKKRYESIPEEYREIIIEAGQKNMSKLIKLTRKENLEAIEAMRGAGVQILEMEDPETLEMFKQMGRKVWYKMAGRLYSRELLDEIVESLEEYRSR